MSIIIRSRYQSGFKSLMYFTVQSNLWIGFMSLWILILMILEFKNKKEYRKNYHYLLKYIFTVSITLTGVVYCAILAPIARGFDPWTVYSILTHVVVPVASIIDFFLDDYKIKFKKKDVLYTLLPPLYYLFFSLVCYLADFKFSDGNNYPYFFLNFGSSAGMFKIITEPYFVMGTFYWLIILAIIVSLLFECFS